MHMNGGLPEKMKAVHGSGYGDIDTMLAVVSGVPIPRLIDVPVKQRPHCMIVKTLAVALAPGDCRVLSGLTRELQGPPSFPYVPGGDCCGIVVELPPESGPGGKNPVPFAVGDRVVARFVDASRGALGEYALVSTAVADKVPETLSSVDAAALISASPAVALAESVQPGERVLVLGAGGGVGSHLCQLLRVRGASFVAGVSRSPERLRQPPILCDDAIDYTTTDVYSLKKYQNEKFDTIFDLALGDFHHLEECVKRQKPLIVKPTSLGGKYITTVPQHGPIYEVHSIWKALEIFLFPWIWKAIVTRSFRRSKLPAYGFGMGLPKARWPATRALELAASGKLKAIVDSNRPFPFTTEGVRAAFRVQESYHSQGKVVIRVDETK